MRVALVVLLLATFPALLGRAAATTTHAVPRVAVQRPLVSGSASVPGVDANKPAASTSMARTAETTPSTVSQHQHVTQDTTGQHGHARSGDAVGGQVGYADSSVSQATATEGTRTSTPDSDGTNEGSHGHGHSSSDTGN